MLKVINHETGAITAYDTIAEALAAGRFLADQLVATRRLKVRIVIGEPAPGILLIGGETQSTTGEVVGFVPLVWVAAELLP